MQPTWGWAPAPPPWRDNRRFARLAAAMWAGGTVVQGIGQAAIRLPRYDDLRTGSATPFGTFATGSILGAIGSLLATAGLVCVIVATWRLVRSNEQLGRPGATWGPGWAIAGHLIPIASVVLPSLQLSELWRGSTPGLVPYDPAWKARPRPIAAVLAIVAQIVASLLGIGGFVVGIARAVDDGRAGISTEERFDELVHDLRGWFVATAVVTAIAVALQAWLLVRIADRQQALHESSPVPPPPTGAPSSAWGVPHQPAGWYPDPSGRFEWRWWDGAAWGAHVSREGLVAHDPPPVGWRG